MQIPDWLDRRLYPFASHTLDLDAGRLHYVDEGAGQPVLLVHGTPTWSFLYRDFIKALSQRYRVVAPDHLGFGLSGKPADWSYRPADHAANLHALVAHLGLEDLALVVHDFGGPIGLSYAIDRPDTVSRLVLFNTWLWSRADDAVSRRASRLFGSAFGRWLYTRLNFSPRILLPAAYGDRGKLTRAIHRHYLAPLGTPQERLGAWTFARELIGSSDWFDGLYRRRDRLAGLPMLICWGLKDPLLKPAELRRLQAAFPHARTIAVPDAGHFVQEEASAAVLPQIEAFLQAPSAVAS